MGKKQKTEAKKPQTKKPYVDKSKLDILPEGIPAEYGIRKTFNHVIPRKKKRTNSIVRMKPLKDRQNYFDVPDFCPAGYTKEQFDLYREELERISELTKEDLREILKLNRQDTTPMAKADLLNKCADGYALGRIPKCPVCFGTNPSYDKYKGVYICAGYREGDSFIKCDSTFERDQIERTPWDNNFQQRQTVRLQRTERKLKHEREYQIQYKKNKKKRIAKEQRRLRGEKSSSSEDQEDENQDKNIKQEIKAKKQAGDHTGDSKDIKLQSDEDNGSDDSESGDE